MYGMRTPSIYIYLMIGFDPDFAPLSIGNLMIFHSIENLIADHVKEFDFKVGNEAYKRRWAKSEYTKRSISIRFSLRGRMLSWPEQWRKLGYRIRGAPEKLGRMLASKPATST
ncbi:MAG: GNAT family N-acetyltransferase, partial [Gammaproteobacteria bacterium]